MDITVVPASPHPVTLHGPERSTHLRGPGPADPIMARNPRGSIERPDLLAQTTVQQEGSGRHPGSEPYMNSTSSTASKRCEGKAKSWRSYCVLRPSGDEECRLGPSGFRNDGRRHSRRVLCAGGRAVCFVCQESDGCEQRRQDYYCCWMSREADREGLIDQRN